MRGRFCDGLGSNIVVQYSVGPIITLPGRITAREYVDLLGNHMHLMIQTLYPNNDTVSKMAMPSFIQLELFNICLKSIMMNFNIFPGQQITTFEHQ
jgi:hypothetical protein